MDRLCKSCMLIVFLVLPCWVSAQEDGFFEEPQEDVESGSPDMFSLDPHTADSLDEARGIYAEDQYEGRLFGVGAYLFGGATSMTTSALKPFFYDPDTDIEIQPNPIFYNVGVGGYGYLNRWMLGATGHSFIGEQFYFEGRPYRMVQSGYHVQLGYDVIKGYLRQFMPYLMVGSSATAIRYNGEHLLRDSTAIEASTDQPLRQGGLSLGLGIHAINFVAGRPKEGKVSGFNIGINAGALVQVTAQEWTTGGQQVAWDATYQPASFYISLTLGGAGFWIKK